MLHTNVLIKNGDWNDQQLIRSQHAYSWFTHKKYHVRMNEKTEEKGVLHDAKHDSDFDRTVWIHVQLRSISKESDRHDDQKMWSLVRIFNE